MVNVAFLVITATNVIGPVLLGRPIPWLVIQIGSVITVAAAGLTVAMWWRRRGKVGGRQQIPVGMLMVACVLFVPWGAFWGVLRP
jgi:uncharacterized protein